MAWPPPGLEEVFPEGLELDVLTVPESVSLPARPDAQLLDDSGIVDRVFVEVPVVSAADLSDTEFPQPDEDRVQPFANIPIANQLESTSFPTPASGTWSWIPRRMPEETPRTISPTSTPHEIPFPTGETPRTNAGGINVSRVEAKRPALEIGLRTPPRSNILNGNGAATPETPDSDDAAVRAWARKKKLQAERGSEAGLKEVAKTFVHLNRLRKVSQSSSAKLREPIPMCDDDVHSIIVHCDVENLVPQLRKFFATPGAHLTLRKICRNKHDEDEEDHRSEPPQLAVQLLWDRFFSDHAEVLPDDLPHVLEAWDIVMEAFSKSAERDVEDQPKSPRKVHRSASNLVSRVREYRDSIVIFPDSWIHAIWTMLMTFLIFYTCSFDLVRSIFEVCEPTELDYVSLVMDTIFVVDVLMNLTIIGYIDERGERVTCLFGPKTKVLVKLKAKNPLGQQRQMKVMRQPQGITLTYLKSRFAFDFITSLPVFWLQFIFNTWCADESELGRTAGRSLRLPRGMRITKILRLLRMARIARSLRAARLVSLLKQPMKRIRRYVPLDVLRIASLFCLLTFFSHLLACLTWMVKSSSDEGLEEWAGEMAPDDTLTKYLFTFYQMMRILFSSETLPVFHGSRNEYLWGSFLSLCSAGVTASIVWRIVTLGVTQGSTERTRQAQLKLLRRRVSDLTQDPYLRDRLVDSVIDIPVSGLDLNPAASATPNFSLPELDKQLFFNISSGLRSELFAEVMMNGKSSDIRQHPLFTADPECKDQVLKVLVTHVRVLRQGETLYNEGDDGTEMSFLVAGRLWVNVLRFGAANPVKTLETGSVMGEEALLLEDQRHYGTIVAAETSVVFVLVLDALQEVLEDFAQVRALIQSRVLLSSDANQIRVLVHALRSTIQHELSVTARTPTPPPLARIGSNFIVNRFASRKLSRERFSSHAHNSGDLDHNELDKRWEAIQVAGRRHAAMLSALAHTLATKPERRLKTMNRFDVFLSYRVASDAELAQLLYYRLRVQGVRVWWDKECLEVGQSWVEGFSNGLAACRYFVVLMSEAALAPLTQLHDCSPCDNVLLEMQMALELKEKGRLSGLQPVLVGRREMSEYGAELFTDFFKSGCLPAGGFPNIEVASVSAALSTHFSRVANTQPSRMRTVSETVNEVLQNQGTFFLGQRDHALRIVVDDILKSCKPVTDTHVDPHARSHHHHAESTPKESVGLEFEHQQ